MQKIQQDDVHIITRHSDIEIKSIVQILETHVYNDRPSWEKFLRLLLLSLGFGFTVAGIIFFFAYNWASLHKFVKLGLIEGLLITAIVFAITSKSNPLLKNIILTVASVLVGILVALFGQIYQTGADSYEIFLVWIISISLWVWTSDFSPLWLLYILLIQMLVTSYTEQATDWSVAMVYGILFTINVLVLAVADFVTLEKIPKWFLYTIVTAAIIFGTMANISIISDNDITVLSKIALLIFTAMVYVMGFWRGLTTKNIVYLALISLSIISIISSWSLYHLDATIGYFFVSLLVIVSITLVTRQLSLIQKKWDNEKR